jgi:hypothetical protein
MMKIICMHFADMTVLNEYRQTNIDATMIICINSVSTGGYDLFFWR